jgi:putative transcriptional regulator
MLKVIEIDRTNLAVMGGAISDLNTWEITANAIGGNMFEGFQPAPKGIEMIRDCIIGKLR